MSLTGRSRVKDLWVFTGPASTADTIFPDSPAPSILNASHGDLRRPEGQFPPRYTQTEKASGHRKFASSPAPSSPGIAKPHLPPLAAVHSRSSTDQGTRKFSPINPTQPLPLGQGHPLVTPPHSPTVLRKPAPRAQVPVSVISDVPEEPQYRAELPSVISEGNENMTGVGAMGREPTVLYNTPPFPVPVVAESPPQPTQTRSITPPLLGPGAFQDRGTTYSTDSCEIPISWTGSEKSVPERPADTVYEDALSHRATTATNAPPSSFQHSKLGQSHRESVGPILPGGWAPTPSDENGPVGDQSVAPPIPSPPAPINEDDRAPVASPAVTHPDAFRKSEAAFIGVMPTEEHDPMPAPYTAAEKGKGKEVDNPVVDTEPTAIPVRKETLEEAATSPVSPDMDGTGWVVVDGELRPPVSPAPGSIHPEGHGSTAETTPPVEPEKTEEVQDKPSLKNVTIATPRKNSLRKASAGSTDKSPSRIRRLFSKSKKEGK